MVGLGTQDSFEEAQDFVATYGTVSFPMLWDPGFDSWAALGIRGQPQAILFSADGFALKQWAGLFDEDEVLRIAAESVGQPPPTTTTTVVDPNRIVEVGDSVLVEYTGVLDDGNVFDTSEGGQPLVFTVGSGQVIPGFEDEILGLKPGEVKTFSLSADRGYGERSEDLVLEFPRSSGPGDIAVGDQVQMSNGAPATVIALSDTVITIDANHPLAGQSLTFTVEIVGFN